jgi:hypothetical protein
MHASHGGEYDKRWLLLFADKGSPSRLIKRLNEQGRCKAGLHEEQ